MNRSQSDRCTLFLRSVETIDERMTSWITAWDDSFDDCEEMS